MSAVWLTTSQVAEQIGETVSNVTRRCVSGELAAKKLGNRWRIHPDDLAAFMKPDNTSTALPQLTARQKRRRSA